MNLYNKRNKLKNKKRKTERNIQMQKNYFVKKEKKDCKAK